MKYDMSFTAAQLKEACRSQGLAVSGNKKQLLARLAAANSSQPAGNAGQPPAKKLRPNPTSVPVRAPPMPIRSGYMGAANGTPAAQQQGMQRAAPPADSRQRLQDKVLDLFKRYADSDNPSIIDEEGIGKLGQDMGIDPSSDVSILVLCHKLNPQKPGQISQEEFVAGMVKEGVDSVERLKRMLPSLDPGFMDQTEFRKFYRFVFTFSREGTKKTVEKDIVCALLPLMLPDSARGTVTGHFVSFLESNSAVTIVTQDQWNSFLEFSRTVGADLDKFDTEGAWPLLLDDFVEYLKAKLSNGATKP